MVLRAGLVLLEKGQLLPQALSEPRIVQPVAGAIPTTLCRLLYIPYMNGNNANYLYTADCFIADPFLYNCCTEISFAILSTDGSAHIALL